MVKKKRYSYGANKSRAERKAYQARQRQIREQRLAALTEQQKARNAARKTAQFEKAAKKAPIIGAKATAKMVGAFGKRSNQFSGVASGIRKIVDAAIKEREARQEGYKNAYAKAVAKREAANRKTLKLFNEVSQGFHTGGGAGWEGSSADRRSVNVEMMKKFLHEAAQQGFNKRADVREARQAGDKDTYAKLFTEWALENYGGRDLNEAFKNFQKQNKEFKEFVKAIKEGINPDTGEFDEEIAAMDAEEIYHAIQREYDVLH